MSFCVNFNFLNTCSYQSISLQTRQFQTSPWMARTCTHSRSSIFYMYECVNIVNHSHIFILHVTLHVHVCRLHMHTNFIALLKMFSSFSQFLKLSSPESLSEGHQLASQNHNYYMYFMLFFILFHVTVIHSTWISGYVKILVGSVPVHSFWQTCRTKETTNYYFVQFQFFVSPAKHSDT